MLNNLTIMGRFVKDPEMRVTNEGTHVASFTLAVDRDYRDKNGDRETDWIDCVAFRTTAEFIGNHFTKGKMAVINGRIQTRNWQDKEGNKRKATEVLVSNIYFGESKTAEKTETTFDPASTTPVTSFHVIQEDEQLPF